MHLESGDNMKQKTDNCQEEIKRLEDKINKLVEYINNQVAVSLIGGEPFRDSIKL